MRTLIATLLLVFLSTVSYSSSDVLTLDAKRTITIRGGIDETIITKVHMLDKLSKQSKDPIYILIDSPGGSVLEGIQFINAMITAKSRGAELTCVVPTMAASMAFLIYTECDNRYAFKYSQLLWHGISVSGMFLSLSADEMEYLVNVFRAWELPLNAKAMEELDIDKELFYYHYSRETMFISTQLLDISPNFLTIIKDIQGIPSIYGKVN